MINGELGINFLEAKMEKVAKDLNFALVMKFSIWRSPIDDIRQQIIKTWGFLEVSTIRFMDNHHILLHLGSERD